MTQELLETTLPLSENARTVLNKRYLKRDSAGTTIETPAEMFRRVAATIDSVEPKIKGAKKPSYEEHYYRMMTELDFLPNSPTLMNAGRELGQLSACFVLPVDDSMESIFEAIKNTALIHKSGGGTGPVDQRRLLRPPLLHAGLRRGHRNHQAGRNAARRQHGDPAGRPSRHHGFHHGQA
jgi:ribonucleoside-diphosphate reductase alpha chain